MTNSGMRVRISSGQGLVNAGEDGMISLTPFFNFYKEKNDVCESEA
jgi:hypothetical protein